MYLSSSVYGLTEVGLTASTANNRGFTRGLLQFRLLDLNVQENRMLQKLHKIQNLVCITCLKRRRQMHQCFLFTPRFTRSWFICVRQGNCEAPLPALSRSSMLKTDAKLLACAISVDSTGEFLKKGNEQNQIWRQIYLTNLVLSSKGSSLQFEY